MRKRIEMWLKLSVLPLIATPLLWLLAASWRVEWRGRRDLRDCGYDRKLVATWHGRLIMTALLIRKWNVHVMVSQHADGEIISRIVERIGFKTVRGSSRRGAVSATMELVDAIQKGATGGMLPDGPTGPRHSAKAGTVWLAQNAQAAILPLSGSADRAWVFRSWDRQLVPKPFAKVVFVVGDAIAPPEAGNAALKKANRALEQTLTALEAECDRDCNQLVT